MELGSLANVLCAGHWISATGCLPVARTGNGGVLDERVCFSYFKSPRTLYYKGVHFTILHVAERKKS